MEKDKIIESLESRILDLDEERQKNNGSSYPIGRGRT